MTTTQSTKLLDRYLQAVRFLLPDRDQQDIIQELRENLVSQIDDREEELGRALRDEEMAQLLRKHGHPVIVAGRYAPNRHLISPVWLPVYWLTLKLGLAVAALVSVNFAIVGAAVYGDIARHLVQELFAYPGRALQVFAWTTLGFALVDYLFAYAKTGAGWDPQRLPKLVPHESLLSRTNAFFELVFTLAALVWLLAVPQNPWLALGPAAAFLDAAPVWGAIYPVLLLLTAAFAVLAAMNLIWPYWTPARSKAKMAVHAVSFALYGYALQAGSWLTAKAGASLPGGADLAGVVNIANVLCVVGLTVASVIAVVELAREVLRWKARRGEELPANSSSARVAQ